MKVADSKCQQVEQITNVIDIPTSLMQPQDYTLNNLDRYQLQNLGSEDPLSDYISYPRVQADIVAQEKAAERLSAEAPQVLETLIAAACLQGKIDKTPLIEQPALHANGVILLKLENLQRQNSFKVRGAAYAVSQLTGQQLRAGISTVSAGNHAQGIALAARQAGSSATVIMSEQASSLKVRQVQALGAEVILHGQNYDEAYKFASTMQQEAPDTTFVHPFDDEAVMTGQSTVGLEVFLDNPAVDRYYFPVGGGGLIAKNARLLKQLKPDVEVVGVQLYGSDAMRRSVAANEIVRLVNVNLLSDGTAVAQPGKATYSYTKDYVDRVITVTAPETAQQMLAHYENTQQRLEVAGSLALAGAVKEQDLKGSSVAICSGGNICEADWQRAMVLVS